MEEYDVIIIGGGPSGLTAAIYAARSGQRTMLIEGGEIGGALLQIEKLENYPGFSGEGSKLAEIMLAQSVEQGAKIEHAFVRRVYKDGEQFHLETDTMEYVSKYIIYCGGVPRNAPRGAEKLIGSGVSYCAVCDGAFFKNKIVVVVGDGKVAIEDSEYLKRLAKKVYLISSRPIVIDGVENIVGKLIEIEGEAFVSGVKYTGGRLAVDGVFLAQSQKPDKIISGLTVSGGGIENENGKTAIENFFVAGDAAKGCIKQVITACASGTTAAWLCK